MGNLIDITARLAERRLAREKRLVPYYEDWAEPSCEEGTGLSREDLEVAVDLLAGMDAARSHHLCDTCGRREAVADVYRSDAVEAGLGGLYQCRRCLIEEIRHNHDASVTKRVAGLVNRVLRERDGDDLVRVDIVWDRHAERAVEFEGVRIGSLLPLAPAR